MQTQFPLPANVDVWNVDLDACPDVDRCQWLPPDDQLRITRMGTPKLKARMAATRMAVRWILARYVRQSPANISILATPLGCPYLDLPSTEPQLFFNLTHADGRMMLAVSAETSLGIDLENMHRRVEPNRLAPMVLTEQELAWMHAQTDRLDAFLRIWTAKEAVLKLWGTGLQIPAKLVSLDWQAFVATVSKDAKYHAGAVCHFHCVEANADWLAHLATPGSAVAMKPHEYRWDDSGGN